MMFVLEFWKIDLVHLLSLPSYLISLFLIKNVTAMFVLLSFSLNVSCHATTPLLLFCFLLWLEHVENSSKSYFSNWFSFDDITHKMHLLSNTCFQHITTVFAMGFKIGMNLRIKV